MKKLILFTILLACVNSYAINGFSIYKMYSQYDTVTHTNLDSNLNRPASWSSLLVDTLDKKFIRFYDLSSHDSTLPYVSIDTIRSNPNLDSTQGNVIHTGKYTFTDDVTFDSANATVINATRLRTGTGYSDSIANTGGIKSQNLWAYNNTSAGSYIGVFKGQGFLPGYPTNYYPVLKTDFYNLYFSTNNKYIATIGQEEFAILDTLNPSLSYKFAVVRDTAYFSTRLGIMTTAPQYPLHVVGNIYSSDSIIGSIGTFTSGVVSYTGDFAGAITGTTLNTGHGANELYAMNQNVTTTSPVTFPTVTADSIKIGGYDYLKVYDTGSFPCTLSTAYVTVQQVGVINYTVVGNQVTLRLPSLVGTSAGDWSSQGELKCGSAPSIVTACDTAYVPVIIFGGSTLSTREAGVAYIRNGFTSIYFYQCDGGNWPTSGNAGWFRKTSFTYTKY